MTQRKVHTMFVGKFSAALCVGRHRTREFFRDTRGSEAVEMVASVAILCLLVMSLMMILSYTLQANQVAYGAKRIARVIEVSGQVTQSQLDEQAKALIPNWDAINGRIRLANADYSDGGDSAKGRIQLRHKFNVVIDGTYQVVLANPGFGGQISLPLGIHVNVAGQSEVYWK